MVLLITRLDTAHYLVTKHSRVARQRRLQLLQPEFTHSKCSSTESSVDDLGTCRGVVLSRAATILRSIETQPSTGRFVHCRRTIFFSCDQSVDGGGCVREKSNSSFPLLFSAPDKFR